MTEDGNLPQITGVIKDHSEEFIVPLRKEVIQDILQNCLPPGFFSIKKEDQEPVLKTRISPKAPGNLTITVFGIYKQHALKFFMEMLSSWLIPGRRLNLGTLFSSEFCMPTYSSQVYMVCEATIHVLTKAELEQIQANLPIIETEICLGMQSSFYAQRILEVKGLSSDAKTSLIQEYIAFVMERKPQVFEFDMLTEVQHVLIMCRDEYKKQRSSRHLARIIGIQYLFRKQLATTSKTAKKRELLLKVFRSELQLQNQKKHILGIIVGVNFLREKEIFEKRHLMHTIQKHIPDAMMVENSFLDNRRSTDHHCTLYVEIEKNTGEKFSGEEINLLRRMLTIDLLDSIEELVHPIFMPRNEEEIMRSILSLSGQVKFIRDLPQVIINFDEQTYSKLVFTIIVVRVLKPGDETIKDLFSTADSAVEYVHDRCKTVGYLRSKYIKEATVFRIKINKDEFIRRDNSIDLNKARQAVTFELLKAMGEFRDFNGGMISKQNELLMDVKTLLESSPKLDELLLENFFFSIAPIVMRTVLEPALLKSAFVFLTETISLKVNSGESYYVQMLQESSFVFVVIKSEQKLNREDLSKALLQLDVKPSEMATAFVKVHDINYHGYILRTSDPVRQDQFSSVIKNTVSRHNEQLC